MTVNRPDGSAGDLVARCQAGDVDAFAELYQHHAGRIFALTSRMSGSPDAGEDLLQEVFLQAHRKIRGFKGDSTIGTWLYRLAINHCLDFVRSRQARMDKVTNSIDDDMTPPAAGRDTPIERIDLERAIRQLPAGCRAAFVLHDVEGYEHREIAEMLGIAEGTSKSQVFKARLKLRAVLA